MAQVKFEGAAPLSQLHKSTPYRPERYGFDDGATPVWQMVPVGDARFMRITVLGAKIGSVDSNPDKIASVAPESGTGARKDVFRIDGKQEGKATVIVRDPKGQELGRLDVLVLRQRTMSVQFFLVSDNAKHTTKTKEDDVKDMVDGANNKVFSRQMNLTFTITAVKPVTISQNLGNPIDFGNIGDMPSVPRRTDAEKRWHALTDKGDTNPKVFNIFLLWDYKSNSPDTSGFVAAKTPITAAEMEKSGANFNMCMMKDVAEEDRAFNIPHLIFAHEAGHYLEGMPFHYPDDSDAALLMRGDGHIGERLAKRDVESMTRRW